MSKTYTVELTIEVKMTRPGYPGRGPDFNSPGEPPEPPEFEIKTITVDGKSVDLDYKTYKAANEAKGLKVRPWAGFGFYDDYDQFFANYIYNNVLDQAHEDDWNDEYDDYDPTP